MKKWLKYYLTNYPIKQVHSSHNGLIQVNMVFNMPRLFIGGMLQSGGMMRRIWDKAIKRLKKESQKVSDVLIIGLGCGDCAFRVEKYYPKAKMVGVEIDKEIIDIAQCYFNLAILKNLEISIDDGAKYVFKKIRFKKIKKYDLIIVDVYLGQMIPKAFVSKKFHLALKKLLKKNGVMIMNHLFFKKHKQRSEKLISTLETIYSKIELMRTASNLLIFARV